MSTEAGEVLLGTITPILKATVFRTVRPLPGETYEELIQDGLGDAAKSLESLERRGKPLMGNSVAYYTLQHLKNGRRMMDSGCADVYSCMRRATTPDDIMSFDAELEFGDDETLTLADMLADHHPDPSEEVGRKLAWEDLSRHLSFQQLKVLRAVAEGGKLSDVAKELGVSPPRVTKIKWEIGEMARKILGDDILNEVVSESAWERDLRCQHDRRESRLDV